MTVAVATPFNMDEQAFLQTMDRLIERFDRYSSGRCFADLDRIRLEHDMEGPLSLFDDVVHELADDLFGGHVMAGEPRHGYDHIGSVPNRL